MSDRSSPCALIFSLYSSRDFPPNSFTNNPSPVALSSSTNSILGRSKVSLDITTGTLLLPFAIHILHTQLLGVCDCDATTRCNHNGRFHAVRIRGVSIFFL